MKSSYYVAAVVKAYRQAVDTYFEDPKSYKFDQSLLEMLMKVSHRDYHTGFYFDEPKKQIYETSSYIRDYDIVGVVKHYDPLTNVVTVEQRNKVLKGDNLEVLSPDGNGISVCVNNMTDESNDNIDSAPRAQMIFKFVTTTSLKPKDMLIKSKGAK